MHQKYSFLILIAVALLASCKKNNPVSNPKQVENESVNLDWLIGNWQRTNDKENKETFEDWEKLSSTEYRGHGYTMVEQDTVWQENIELVKMKDGNWTYNVFQKNDPTSTDFKLTAISGNSFTAENPENEFPKTIKYHKSENGLIAIISDGETEVEFEFEERD